MSILVKNVSKFYSSQKALDNVSFEINKGEVVGFLGPNGAGKSTMMKIITGFIPASEGDVFINSLNIVNHSIETRRLLGYLPENNPLYPEMYVKEYLGFVAELSGLHKNKSGEIEKIVKITGLEREQSKTIGKLSKGYRQRVGLAQALLHNPEVLILDEPTSGLDPNQIVEIRNLIREVGKEKTVMLSTHIMQEVEAICDRVIIIHKGKVVKDGKAGDILKAMDNEDQIVTVEFNQEIELNLLNSITGLQKISQINSFTWEIEAPNDMLIREILFQFAVTNNLVVLSMQKKEKRLEDVFRELTTM